MPVLMCLSRPFPLPLPLGLSLGEGQSSATFFFGAPGTSRLAPEGAQLRVQPQTECQDAELNPHFFNHVVSQLCKLHSQETLWVCSCCRGLFWLCSPVGNVPPFLFGGGKGGAGSRLGKGFGSSKGFASPAACLDGSGNTALKENRLLDSLEKVSSQPLGKTVRGQELRQKKGCCSFCYVLAVRLLVLLLFVFLQLRKTPGQSVCCGKAGFEAPLAFPMRQAPRLGSRRNAKGA